MQQRFIPFINKTVITQRDIAFDYLAMVYVEILFNLIAIATRFKSNYLYNVHSRHLDSILRVLSNSLDILQSRRGSFSAVNL